MLLKVDAKALEWRSYIELSRDSIGIKEILEGQDVHTNNQVFFNLPSRLISKVFLFRWIYRGSAWAYANDPDFIPTSNDPTFWQEVINKANNKYKEFYSYQEKILYQAKNREIIRLPSGLEFLFDMQKGSDGLYYWDEKQIVNYINQGFGANLMIIARRNFRRSLSKYQKKDVLLINTVHDDIQVDVAEDPELLYNICIEMEKAFTDIHKEFKKCFDYDLVVPFEGEVSFGKNLYDLTNFNKNKGREQFHAN